MGLVSNDLKNIADRLRDAKNSINAKYTMMRVNNTAYPQADLEHLYINELPPSIDKIECLNTYGDTIVDPKKVLEGTIVFSQGKPLIGEMKDYGDISAILYEGNAVLNVEDGHHEDGIVKIQFQEKTVTPNNTLQVIEPDQEHVLSRVFVDGVQTQHKTVTPGTEPQNVNPDPGFYLSSVYVEGDLDLKPENIKPGVNIFGVTGAMPTISVDEILDVNNTSVTIPVGYSDGTGKVKIQLQQKTVMPGTANKVITPTSNYVLSKVTVEGDPDLKPENIRSGVEIFGVVGSMQNNSKTFKLNKNQPTDESPAGYYQNKVTAEITDYDVVYVVNDKGQIATVQTVTYGQAFNLINAQPTHNDGSVFMGWSKTPTSTVAEYTAGQRIYSNLVGRGDVCVLYAVWKQNEPPSLPIISLEYENDGKLQDNGTETAIITVIPGVDPEGQSVVTSLICDNTNVTLVKVAGQQNKYKATFKDAGIYVFVATSTDPVGLSSTAIATESILKSDGSFGGQGVFTKGDSGASFKSAPTDFIKGCYISHVTLNILVGSGHSNPNDYVDAHITKSDGSIVTERIHTGSFGNTTKTIQVSFTIGNDVRQIAFEVVVPGSSHNSCIDEANSKITWDVTYSFDMSLWY